MRRLYFENVSLEDEQIISCHNALVELAQIDLVRIFSLAAKEAHANAPTAITAQEFWENLFIINGTGNKPLLEEGRRYSSRVLPADPYLELDLPCWLKYLYRGRQRKDAQNNWIDDTDAVLQFFRINYDHANHQYLSDNYGRQLNQMINIRNQRIGHQSPAELQRLNMEALTKHRDTMLELLEPMCRSNWSGQQASQALVDKILDVFYARLGEVRYSIAHLLRYINIPSGESARVEKLMIAADLQVDDGKVTLSMNPTEFADDLLKVMKRAGISDEARAAQLRSRLPGNEAEVASLFIQKDSDNSMEKQSMKALEELVAAGNHDAEFEMAWRWYTKKDGDVKENRTEAVKWFEKAAHADHAHAQRVMGIMLRGGWYIKQDLDAALYWLRAAAENRDDRAHYLLGECYECGIGVEKNAEKAFSWYEKGATLKDTKCQLARARCMMQGIGTVRDVDTAVFEYQKLERKQIPEASWYLGTYYKPDDPEKALRYFQKAADLNYSKAQYDLALYYEEGAYLEEDPHLVEELVNKAAIGGDPRAQYRLGCAFKNGTNGKPKDDKQAFAWFLKAAKQGHVDSSYEVACCYKDGKGVERDQWKADKYLRLPAKKGKPEAMGDLGISYLGTNNHLLVDDALRYLEQAAEQGYAPAALRLGEHFDSYDYFQKDKLLFWYEKAGKLGDPQGYYCLAKYYERQAWYLGSEDEDVVDEAEIQKALPWFWKAANQGHVDAMRELANYLLSGKYTIAVPHYHDMKALGIILLKKAMSKGSAWAAEALGRFWEKEGDTKEAISCYRFAGKTLLSAQYLLAELLHKEGSGREALEYYRYVAEYGHKEAQFMMYRVYMQGVWGVKKDPHEAMKWLRKAAEAKYLKALHQMGLCYELGICVPVDIHTAMEWYEELLEYDYYEEYEHYDAVRNRLNELKNK